MSPSICMVSPKSAKLKQLRISEIILSLMGLCSLVNDVSFWLCVTKSIIWLMSCVRISVISSTEWHEISWCLLPSSSGISAQNRADFCLPPIPFTKCFDEVSISTAAIDVPSTSRLNMETAAHVSYAIVSGWFCNPCIRNKMKCGKPSTIGWIPVSTESNRSFMLQ